MASASPQPLPKKARTRVGILAAAADLFGEQGVSATTIEQIAEHAGVSAATVYVHFGTKQAITVEFIAESLKVGERYLQEAAASSDQPLERVVAAGEAYFRFLMEEPTAARLAAINVLQPDRDPEYAEAMKELGNRVGALVMGVAADLKAAMTDGAIEPVPIEEAMVFLWGAWNGVSTLVLRQDHLAIPPEVGRRALQRGAMMLGLRPPTDAAQPDAEPGSDAAADPDAAAG